MHIYLHFKGQHVIKNFKNHLQCVCLTIRLSFWSFFNFFQPGLRDPRFSKRLQAYNDLRSNISQHTIKMNFLQRVHRYLLTTYSSEISLFYVSALNIF